MITASIVVYHTAADELLRVINCAVRSVVEILYIIDNSSNDSLRELKDVSEKIVYIHSDNLGYGSGHNIGIRKAVEKGATYHVVLNPDVYWDDSVIETLSQFMDSHSDCGLVMPRILYPDGGIQHLCKLLPTPMDLLGRRFISIKKYQEKSADRYELHFTGYDKVMEVPSLSGCFMFMRVDVLKKVDGFDERFFMYAEDLDLCRRIGEISKTMFYPMVSVYHEYEKGSYKNRKLLKYHLYSIIKYFNKWGWIFDKKRTLKNNECLLAFSLNKQKTS